MHVQTKKEVKKIVGGLGLIYKQIWSPHICYVSGCEEVDDAFNYRDIWGPINPIIRKAKNGYWISVGLGGAKSGYLGIPYSSIMKIDYIYLEMATKDKSSLATSTIVGAAIAGPLGAAVGALNSMALGEGWFILKINYELDGMMDAFQISIPVVLKKSIVKFFGGNTSERTILK